MKKILLPMFMIILSSIITVAFANTTSIDNTSIDNTSIDNRTGNSNLVVDQKDISTQSTRYVTDNASLLTAEEVLKLEAKSVAIKERYNFDVVIVTTSDTLDKSPMDYSNDFYRSNNYHKDGIIFLISMADRDFDISTFNYGEEVFTDDYGLDYLFEKIIPYFSRGEYNEGFSTFLNHADTFLLQAKSGTPYNINNKIVSTDSESEGIPKHIIMIGVIIGALIISVIAIVMMASKMNTKKPKNLAKDYVNNESIKMTDQSDLFLYKNVVKKAKPKRTKNSSGGSISSSRSSGRSGKF